MADLAKRFQTGGIVGLVTVLLAWLYGLIFKNGIANITFATVTPVDINVKSQLVQSLQVQSGTIGGKIMGALGGIVPSGATMFNTLLWAFVIGALTYVLGAWLYEMKFFDFLPAKTKQGKLAWKMVLGSLLLALAFPLSLSLPTISGLTTYLVGALVLLVYFWIVGWATYAIASRTDALKNLVE